MSLPFVLFSQHQQSGFHRLNIASNGAFEKSPLHLSSRILESRSAFKFSTRLLAPNSNRDRARRRSNSTTCVESLPAINHFGFRGLFGHMVSSNHSNPKFNRGGPAR
jgi:hypothetical protein